MFKAGSKYTNRRRLSWTMVVLDICRHRDRMAVLWLKPQRLIQIVSPIAMAGYLSWEEAPLTDEDRVAMVKALFHLKVKKNADAHP